MTYRIEAPWAELRPLFRYINELWNCKCLPDLHLLNLFPNPKELTESCAVYNTLCHKARIFELGDPEVTLVSVADGNTPRTAAMFAFRTAWQCISIDPRFKKVYWPQIKRLTCFKSKIEDCGHHHFKKLVIVAVHSHAPLDVVCEKFTGDVRVVAAMPCCTPQVRERPPDFTYIDKGVWSPKNKVLVWIDREGKEQNETGLLESV